jgi:hypothetical protein
MLCLTIPRELSVTIVGLLHQTIRVSPSSLLEGLVYVVFLFTLVEATIITNPGNSRQALSSLTVYNSTIASKHT